MTSNDLDSLQALDIEGWSALERLGRALRVKDASVQATLDAILVAAVDLIEGSDFGGLNLLMRDRFEPQAVLGWPPHALDQLQQQTGTGPCIDASREQAVIRIDEMSQDQRWPEYASLAISLEVRAMLCVPLWVDGAQLGSLSLYSRRPRAFGDPGDHHERLANLFAAHAALALSDAQRSDNLRIALVSRDVIGQAKGILMERLRITPEAAFALLAGVSQRHNRRLNVVAEDFVRTGELPT
jgi:GAF domain-containing protein